MSRGGSPGSNEVGRLHVTIDANTDGVSAGLANTERQAKAAGDSIGQTFKSATKPVRDVLQGINGIVGSIAGIGALVGTIAYLANAWERVDEAVRKASRTVTDFEIAARSSAEAFASLGSGGTVVQLQAAMDQITKKQLDASKALQEQARSGEIDQRQYNARLKAVEDAARAERDNAKAIYESYEAMRQLTAAGGLYIKTQQDLMKIEDARRKSSEQTTEDMRTFLKLQNEAYKAATAAQERLRDEARAAAAEQRAFVRSMRDEIRSAFPADKIISDMGRIVAALEQIKQQRGR